MEPTDETTLPIQPESDQPESEPVLQTFFFTFGVQYHDGESGIQHPAGGHKDGWFEILARDEDEARVAMFKLCCYEYAFCYQKDKFEPRHFPLGCLRTCTATDVIEEAKERGEREIVAARELTNQLIARIQGGLQENIALSQRQITFLTMHKDKLTDLALLGIKANVCYHYIDFDNLNHDQAVKVLLAFPGTWEKHANETTIDYIREQDNMFIRCYHSAPPPNCKIIEEEVEVPAHTKLVRRLQCLE